ncbi:MAG: hypothetical protein KIT34_10915 [Cyanobacteria bacterium TGS_CYA1]|nr:hypothetical protein [Cyanobacteria bacterium TGS_CYA1]
MSRFNDDTIKMALANAERIGVENWEENAIQNRINTEQIYKMVILDDESLYVFYQSIPAGGKHHNMGVSKHFIVKPSFSSYKTFIEISGLSKPGDERSFL